MKEFFKKIIELFSSSNQKKLPKSFHIEFKHPVLKVQLDVLRLKNPQLYAILIEIASFVSSKFDKNLVITSVYRKKTTDSGVHELYRGIDLRSRIFTEDEIKSILKFIENTYIYDPERPQLKVSIYHKVEGNAYHFHIQNLPGKTIRRK